MTRRDAVLLDLDGTLCDTATVEHLVAGHEKDFAAFHRASAGCPTRPEVEAALRDAQDRGLAVILWTAREFVWRDLTLDWLDRHHLAHEGLYMRISADYRPAVTIKTGLLDDIADDGFTVVEAWEDDPKVVDLLRARGVPEVHQV